jgi:hypothetical protein
MTEEISQAGDRLRKAVAGEAFAEAESCVAEYSRAVAEAAGRLPEGDGQALETVREAVDLLTWAERAIRASRGHTMNELARVTAGRAYRAPAGRREPAYRLEG